MTKIKDFEDMKFDCIIMNPPYDKNLHLKILAEAIKHLNDDDESVCVNLSPVLWLEDPHAHVKEKSTLFKFKKTVSSKIESLDFIDVETSAKMFDIGIFSKLGIYVCKKNDVNCVDAENIWKKNYSDFEIRLFENVYALPKHIDDMCENNKRDGIRVIIAFIAGNRGTLPIYKDLAYVIDGMKDGKDWTKCKNNGGYEKTEGLPIPFSVRFNSENEAMNFYNSCKTVFYKFISRRYLLNQNIQLKFLPWMGDSINPRTRKKGYESEWTDEDFYQFFNITEDEKKIIEETMKKYRRP